MCIIINFLNKQISFAFNVAMSEPLFTFKVILIIYGSYFFKSLFL